MEDKKIIELMEQATGLTLDEEKLKGVIDERLEKMLRKAQPQKVSLGAPEGEAKGGFKGFLNQVRLAGMENAPDQGLTRVLPSQVKDLREGATSAGGYLAPKEQSGEVLDLVDKFSAVKPLCRQVPMSANQINFPTVAGGLTAYWVPEASDTEGAAIDGTNQADGEVPRSDPTFGQMALSAHVLAVKVVVSNQLLADSDPAVDGVLKNLFAETIGSAFDVACLRGAGTATDPVSGLAGRITTNSVAAGAAFDFDDISSLIFKVYENSPHAARVPVLGHPKAEKVMMTIKDSGGEYIYRHPGQERASGDGMPRVWGEPFVRDPNILTNLGTGSDETRLFAGDFAGSAVVGVRSGLVIKTNPWAEPYFSYNQTCFLAEVRMGFTLSDQKRFAMLTGVPTA